MGRGRATRGGRATSDVYTDVTHTHSLSLSHTHTHIEYKSTIMEMRNIIKNQERVIEELMLNILNIKIENEQIEKKLNYLSKISLQKRDHFRRRFLTI